MTTTTPDVEVGYDDGMMMEEGGAADTVATPDVGGAATMDAALEDTPTFPLQDQPGGGGDIMDNISSDLNMTTYGQSGGDSCTAGHNKTGGGLKKKKSSKKVKRKSTKSKKVKRKTGKSKKVKRKSVKSKKVKRKKVKRKTGKRKH